MGRASIWTVEGRKEQIGVAVSETKLNHLKKKRNGQLKRLIEKYKKLLPKKARRMESKLVH